MCCFARVSHFLCVSFCIFFLIYFLLSLTFSRVIASGSVIFVFVCHLLPFIAISNANVSSVFFFSSFLLLLSLLFNLITIVGMLPYVRLCSQPTMHRHIHTAVCLDNLVIRSVRRRRRQWCCNLCLVYENEFTRNYLHFTIANNNNKIVIIYVFAFVSLQILSILKWQKSEQFIHVF